MKFDDKIKLDPKQVDDRRFPKKKTVGIVAVLLTGLIANFTSIKIKPSQTAVLTTSLSVDSCLTGLDANTRTDCRIVGTVNSLEKYWKNEFVRNRKPYRSPKTVLFTDTTSTNCGIGNQNMGPFYCPADNKIYIDLTFYNMLRTRFGAKGGPFAEAYVIAHEYGHHIQTLSKIRVGNETGPSSGSVRLELQADCYAGVWASNATKGSRPYLKEISKDDISVGLDAAAAVGDDRIQQRSTGRVKPELWSHGSSESRQKWFTVGYSTGEPSQCDTFNLLL